MRIYDFTNVNLSELAKEKETQVGRNMHRGFTLTMVAGLLGTSMLIGAPMRVNAQSDSGIASSTGPVIDVDVANANLLSVVQVLKAQSNAQIVVVTSTHYQPVTLTVTAPLGDALRYVAQSAGATVTRDDNGVYTFRPAGDSDDQASQPVITPAADRPLNLHSERIPLEYVDPNYILTMLGEKNGFRMTDPRLNPISEKALSDPDSSPEITASPSGFTNALPNSGTVVPGSGPGAQGNDNGSVTANYSSGQPGDSANQAGFPFGGGGGQVINPFAGGGVQPAQGGGFNGGGFPGGNGAAGAGTNLRPQGITSIVANEQDNSLIVQGTPEGIAELKQLISFLDRAPKQVQIKVQYVTTTVSDADQFGISWDLIPFPNADVNFNGNGNVAGTTGGTSGGTSSGSTGGAQQGTTLLSYAQGNLVARMQFLLTTTKGKLENSITISGTNNTPASAQFNTVLPYQTSTTVSGGTAGATTSNSTNFINVPNQLTVTPRINGDNSVSLLIVPQISTATVPTGGGAPTVSTQTVQTYRTLANGETMVIGGLVTKVETRAVDKVPFLSDLPIIGPLFRTRNSNNSGSELLIFVTPEVLPPVGAYYNDISPSGAAPLGGTAGTSTSGGGAGVGVTP